MPNPRNRIKQTGDTRLPQGAAYELDDDLDDEVDGTGTQPEAAVFHPAASGLQDGGQPGMQASSAPAAREGRGTSGGGMSLRGMSSREYLADARGQVLARPLACLGGAFLLGFVLARLTR